MEPPAKLPDTPSISSSCPSLGDALDFARDVLAIWARES
jgi:hypothetical protein